MVAIDAAAAAAAAAVAVAEAGPVYAVGSKLEVVGSAALGNEENSDHGPVAESAVVARYRPD